MVKVNSNILQLKPSATLAINEQVRMLRSAGKEVYHFGFGQSPFGIHSSIVEALQQYASSNLYLPSTGLEALKSNISAFLEKHQNLHFRQESIFIGPGSKELLFQLIYLLDGLFLVPKGSWVSYLPQVKVKNAEFLVIDTEFKDHFKVRAEALRRVCEENPKVQKTLILNSPNNPTGAVYSDQELTAIAAVCSDHQLIVLSDEIYSQINFQHPFTPSIATHYPDGTIVLGGLSKVFAAGGYRMGFAAIPQSMSELYQPLQSFFSETFSAVAAPIQYAAVRAYEFDNELNTYILDCNKILSAVAEYVHVRLSERDILCTEAHGAFYMMIGFEKHMDKIKKLGIHSSKDLATYILTNHQVALLPASDFYFNDEELFLRLAFVDFDGRLAYDQFSQLGKIDRNFIENNMPNIVAGVQALCDFVTEI